MDNKLIDYMKDMLMKPKDIKVQMTAERFPDDLVEEEIWDRQRAALVIIDKHLDAKTPAVIRFRDTEDNEERKRLLKISEVREFRDARIELLGTLKYTQELFDAYKSGNIR